jgi:hypothetical protein
MKVSKLIILSSALAVSCFAYMSCNKETPAVATVDSNISSYGTVQVFDAVYKSDRNYIYVDNKQISGAKVAFGGVYPGTAYSFTVTPGSKSFLIKDTLVTATQVPLTFTQQFDAGKSYTIFTYDTITSPKQITVTNDIVIPTDTTARLRFANMIYSNTAVPAVDVYSFRRGTSTPVFSNVATASVTGFIPYASGLTDTLYVYATGTTTPLLVKSVIPSFTPSRSYTSVYAGSYKVASGRSISTFATY